MSSSYAPAGAGQHAPPGRIVALDVLRGFAILWVVAYHLWSDVKFPDVRSVDDRFSRVPDLLLDGRLLAALKATGTAFVRVGYLGVPLFMIVSGASLAIVILRRGDDVQHPMSWIRHRVRRVMIPYWFGWAYTMLFAAGVAAYQWLDAGDRSLPWWFQHGVSRIDLGDAIAGLLLVPRVLQEGWQFAPEGSLWFVLLIIQYYLLFPLLLRLLERWGALVLVAGSLAVTWGSLVLLLQVHGDLYRPHRFADMLAPFRIFEFCLGIAGGYLLVRHRAWVDTALRHGRTRGGLMVVGLVLVIYGVQIGPFEGVHTTLQVPLVTAGLGLFFFPLVAKVPGRLEVSALGRALAWTGAVSFTILIVNEPLRYVTRLLLLKAAPDGLLTVWVVAVYLPLTFLLARPLAVFLGLVQRAADAHGEPGEPLGDGTTTGGDAGAPHRKRPPASLSR